MLSFYVSDIAPCGFEGEAATDVHVRFRGNSDGQARAMPQSTLYVLSKPRRRMREAR